MLIEKLRLILLKQYSEKVCCWFWHRISAHKLSSTTPNEQESCVFTKACAAFNWKMHLIWKWVQLTLIWKESNLKFSISVLGKFWHAENAYIVLPDSTASGICSARKELKDVLVLKIFIFWFSWGKVGNISMALKIALLPPIGEGGGRSETLAQIGVPSAAGMLGLWWSRAVDTEMSWSGLLGAWHL